MKLYFKKIIAREFLILIVVIAIGFISFSLTFPYNFYLKSKEKRNISEIEVKSQQLYTLFSSAYKMNEELIKTLYNRAQGFGYKKSKAEFLNLLHKDQEVFDDMYAFFVETNGYRDRIVFSGLIGKIASQDTLLAQQIKDNEYELRTKSLLQDLKKLRDNNETLKDSIMTKYDQYLFSIRITVIAFVILILLRFIYYGISWSISTLRNDETDK